MGELPVDELDETVTETALALAHIDTANKEIQLEDWYFNTERAVLRPDDKGHITLPFDAVRAVDLPPHISIIHNKLYNDINQTYVFNKEIECRVIKLVEFEDLPLSFAIWVTLRAAKKYQNNILTSPALAENLAREELEAMLVAKKEHRKIVRPNLKGTSAGYHIQKVLRRR